LFPSFLVLLYRIRNVNIAVLSSDQLSFYTMSEKLS
jgi:hypothetical protein